MKIFHITCELGYLLFIYLVLSPFKVNDIEDSLSLLSLSINIWDKVFKNGPSKICDRQSSTNFTWSILEYFVPYILNINILQCNAML